MKKKILILLALLAFLALTGFSFAEAENVPLPLTVYNLTFDKVYMELEGQDIDKDYALQVDPGENNFTVLKGTYKYYYESCFRDHKGEIVVKDDDNSLTIDSCPGQPVPTKLAIYSHYEEDISISFYGPLEHPTPEDFEVDVSLGKTRYDAWSGTYLYSFDACGTTFSGELYVTKNGKTKFYLKSCATKVVHDIFEEFATDESTDFDSAAKFRIANSYTDSFQVTLIGAQAYLLDVDPGLNRYYNIPPGSYRYIFAHDGQRFEGVLTVGDSGETIFAIPFPAFAEGE